MSGGRLQGAGDWSDLNDRLPHAQCHVSGQDPCVSSASETNRRNEPFRYFFALHHVAAQKAVWGHEHACRLLRQDGESTSVTGRNRCTAEDFRGVPETVVSNCNEVAVSVRF